ncbi:MAG TPA: PadR family transcriptional regulator [Gammaproteobacteria bacterium]|nr:PadR family transcriptional regulator [Gammaproteobacteria bacterium]
MATETEDEALQGQQRKFQKELNAGIVSLVLLSIMAGAREPLYGYQIAKQMEHEGIGTAIMKQGTLYPVLRSLCAAGLLDSKVEPSVSGPPRRYYHITEAGQTVLAQWKNAWVTTRDFVDAILRGLTP